MVPNSFHLKFGVLILKIEYISKTEDLIYLGKNELSKKMFSFDNFNFIKMKLIRSQVN